MSTEKRGAILRTLFKHGDPKSPLYRVLYHPGRKGKRKRKPPVAPRSGKGERAPLAPGVRTQTDAAKKKSKTDYIPSDSIDAGMLNSKRRWSRISRRLLQTTVALESLKMLLTCSLTTSCHLLEQMTPEDREKAERSDVVRRRLATL